jgi:hypothetical protein
MAERSIESLVAAVYLAMGVKVNLLISTQYAGFENIRAVIIKKRLMWISILTYAVVNAIYLALDITYALYHPNER